MDATGWGVLVAVVAAVPSWIGVGAAWVKAGDADRRADRAEKRAGVLVIAAQDANVQYQRMADALERQMSAQMSTQAGQESVAVSPAITVEFFIEHRKGSWYALRNLGPEEASEVRVVNLPEHLIWREMPDGVTLGPLQSHEFFLSGTGQQRVPSEIQVSCDQLEAPAFVPVPRRF